MNKNAILFLIVLCGLISACERPAQNTQVTDAQVKQALELIQSNKTPIDIPDSVWKKILTDEQYYVLREKGTETPFTGELLHNNKTGIYVTAGCGQPVFSSDTKFDSGTGWPSFYAPISDDSIKLVDDYSLGIKRTEVVGSRCNEHLGHVFDDGPPPTGLRYCINSAALKFIEANSTN